MPKRTFAVNGVSIYELPITGFDKLADLRTAPNADNGNWTERAIAAVFGSSSFNDGNFFFYAWIPDSVQAENVPNVVKPTAITGAGRWELISWNSGGSPVTGWKTGTADPNGSVTGDSIGQRYYQDMGDSFSIWYWNGTEWLG